MFGSGDEARRAQREREATVTCRRLISLAWRRITLPIAVALQRICAPSPPIDPSDASYEPTDRTMSTQVAGNTRSSMPSFVGVSSTCNCACWLLMPPATGVVPAKSPAA